jgi:hypothetical protein
VIQFTEHAAPRAYPPIRMWTEEPMNITIEELVSGVVLWLGIIAVFAVL